MYIDLERESNVPRLIGKGHCRTDYCVYNLGNLTPVPVMRFCN